MPTPTLNKTMTTIAAHLPGEWTVENNAAWINTLHRKPDGLRICARSYKERIELYPTPMRSEKYPSWTYEDHRHHITISPTRPPAAAAKDIARRLIPGAEKFHLAGLEWLADLEAQQDAKAATLFAIESLPGANRYHQQENRVHGQGWTAQVNGGESIDLTIRGLTRAQALAVLAALPTA